MQLADAPRCPSTLAANDPYLLVVFIVDPAISTDQHAVGDEVIHRAVAIRGACFGVHGVQLGTEPLPQLVAGNDLAITEAVSIAQCLASKSAFGEPAGTTSSARYR